MEFQHKYISSLTNFMKVLFKSKKYKNDIMRFLAASVQGNKPRAKLGHSLVQNKMMGQLNKISSDAFCFNAMYVIYEFCIPFLNLNDPKAMWKKIDPEYIPSLFRLDLSDETPLCSNKSMKKDVKFKKEFGTISEFYFLMSQQVHFGLMHSIRKYLDIRKMLERMEEEKKL